MATRPADTPQQVDFIDSPDFRKRGAEKRILAESDQFLTDSTPDASTAKVLREMPSHLARFCETPLLPPEAEAALFRRMNYAKYRANLALGPETRKPSEKRLAESKRWLADAEKTRNRIVSSNLRLPISIVKKVATPMVTFDELLSDAMVSLLHSVDKFDYSRGFRFSTYAYRAISRQAYRSVADFGQQSTRFQSRGEWMEGEALAEDENRYPEQQWSRWSEAISELLDTLSDRERKIIECRFALGQDLEPRTFQSLADEFGVSKERVRQIEKRAVEKLQDRAKENLHNQAVATA